ncbi:hypothetical protein [Thermoflavimicrobium dichotomicum]|uniref:Uncharacterized protein n=1 Tax=Thermoflavimicrobium dichotomicum TaxID=46223 RepID=A0A1I3MMP1_9BACL|nr:hypothetical protein [Thermoflavimicrobium dichotomicum]SFI98394.1 hypothetical protein SAMN05421852_103134 [Thermoflavimicrobium dichotomicum]
MGLITIWGDESSQNAHKYMVLGTIWENPSFAADLERVESRDGSQIQLQIADVFAGAIAYLTLHTAEAVGFLGR